MTIINGKLKLSYAFKNKTDPEAYDTFASLFHPVIGEYHKVDVATLKSVHDLGDAEKLEDLPKNYADAIVSTRVRVGRTVKGFPMASKLTREQRCALEAKVKEACLKMDGELAGTYKSLTEMTKAEKDALIEEHILFNDADDKYLRSAGGYDDWPVRVFLTHPPPSFTSQKPQIKINFNPFF
jgi:hypothetical protein